MVYSYIDLKHSVIKGLHCTNVHVKDRLNSQIDWLLSIKQFFTNVWYHKLEASLTLMALFYA